MRITWSLPVRGEMLGSSRGDLVRARCLIEALRAAGHDVQVVEDGTDAAARLRVGGYRTVVRRLLPRLLALQARDAVRVLHARSHGRRVAAAARAHEAELIVETQVHFADSGARAANITGLPLLLDDCSPWSEELALGCGAPGLARRAFRRQARAARAMVVSSYRLSEVLAAEGVPREKIHVLSNAAVERTDRDERERMRERLGLSRAVVVGFAGSFQPWHGVELLVEALARTPVAIPLHLLLIGDGPRREAALARAKSLGLGDRIVTTGAVPGEELPDYLAACDIGALPASNEYGQPMKLLEYAASGLASVAPDLPPVREVLEHGSTGLLFRPGDAAALARHMTTLAADGSLRARIGAAARQRALADGGWRARATLLLSCLGSPDTEQQAVEAA